MRDPIILADPKERAAEREADQSWNDYRIKEVENDEGDEATVTVGDALWPNRKIGFGGWTTRMPWPISPRPAVGMKIRVWSNGSRNHGVTLLAPPDEAAVYDPPIPVYYKTKREVEVEHAAWIADHQKKQRQDFVSQVTKLDEAFEALHPVLKRRIQRFRDEDPNFRWQSEAYEMASCSEGTRLYNAAMDPATGVLLKHHLVRLPTNLTQSSWDIPDGDMGVLDWPNTPEMRLRAIDAINSKVNGYNYKLMEELFPWIDPGHSGNTWGHAVKFAFLLIRDGDEAKL